MIFQKVQKGMGGISDSDARQSQECVMKLSSKIRPVLLFITLLTIILALLAGLASKLDWFGDRLQKSIEIAPVFKNDLSEDSINMKDRFKYRLDSYYLKLDRLAANMNQMIILILLATSVFFASSKSVVVPGINVKITHSVFYFFLTAALLLTWFQFGYLFHSVISERLNLFSLLELTSIEVARPEPNDRIDGSLFSILNDGGFVDLYFRANLPEKIVGLPVDSFSRFVAMIIGGMTFGAMFGSLHALILAMALDKWHSRRVYKVTGICLYVLLTCSHVQFWLQGRNVNTFQFFILGTALFVLWIVTGMKGKICSAKSAAPPK